MRPEPGDLVEVIYPVTIHDQEYVGQIGTLEKIIPRDHSTDLYLVLMPDGEKYLLYPSQVKPVFKV